MKQIVKLIPLVLILFLLVKNGLAQITSKKITIQQIPSSIKYKGNVIDAFQWKDSQGENILILTETGEFAHTKENPDSRDAELYGYHFVKKEKEWKLLWKITDFIQGCDLDITLQFKKETTSITDLNKNNIAETWLFYELSCKGDVSPNDIKLIMHEGEKKYAIRGNEKMIFKTDLKEKPSTIGGEKIIDAAFKTGPASFLNYANKLWEKNNSVTIQTYDK